MLSYDRDAFAALLLTMALLPDHEEYQRPLSTKEFRRLEKQVKDSSLKRVGALQGTDVYQLTTTLNMEDDEAYRIYGLVNRNVQMGILIEKLLLKDIDVVCTFNREYAERIRTYLKDAAPIYYYYHGNYDLFERPAISILGNSGVRTTPELRNGIRKLVQNATAHGFSIITGGEPGVSKVALDAVVEFGGTLIDVLGGNMYEHMENETIKSLLDAGRAGIICTEHPEAMLTVSHAANRNRLIFALSDAAFVCNTDGKRAEVEAVHGKYAEWIYAWTGHPSTAALISAGAAPVADLAEVDLDKLAPHWRRSGSQQMNMFDLL
ncbi:MAG: DNA-processing protein DprA [Clostridia bacterium]|nr:DNA-processing protein DprA [Clostridia bacterium]